MRDLGNSVGNVEELRKEREARMNPPKYEAGQGNDDDWSFLDDTQGGDNSSMEETNFDDLSSMGGGLSQFNNGNQQQATPQSLTSTEDKVIEGTKVVLKYVGKGGKEVISGIHSGFSGSDAFYWTVYGKKVLQSGIWVSVIGLVLTLLGLFTSIQNGFWVMIGGGLGVSVGIFIFSFNVEKSKNLPPEQKVSLDDTNQVDNENSYSGYDEEDDEDYGSWGSDEDDSSGDDIDLWSMDDETFSDEVNEVSNNEVQDIGSAIDSIRRIEPHTQTRQYLFEEYSKILPKVSPDFAELKVISENSDSFIQFDKILIDASLQSGVSEDKAPTLLELRENQFIIQLKATRPSGIKEDIIADEISRIYSMDDYGRVIHEGVYATTSSVGRNLIINIFKGEGGIVSLADTYNEVKDFVLNTNIKKPIVMGVNEFGDVWKFDAEKVFSYIISGKPRSGKSWVAVALVSQLAMYSSPKEVVFEAFDVKGVTSDYAKMNELLPHFKGFYSTPREILNRLRYLNTTEAVRRERILKEYDVLNIADLKSKGVSVDLPYLYIIIDELIGLKDKLTKDENTEFKELLNTLVTQRPNIGYRVILVPHRVTNDVISKTTYTLVGFMACVGADFNEIKDTLSISKKDFPYNLPNLGDMALKTSEINKGVSVYCHGVAMTTSNEKNEDVYRYLNSLWGMLEPDIVEVKEQPKEEFKGHDLFNDSEDNVDESFWDNLM